MFTYSVFILLICVALSEQRKISSSYNPGCGSKCNESIPVNLLYAQAVGERDSVHYVFSCGATLGPPSIMVLRSNSIAEQLKFNWSKLLSEEIADRTAGITLTYPNKLDDVALIVFNRIFEFNDSSDKANISVIVKSDAIRPLPLNNVLWRMDKNSDSVFTFVGSQLLEDDSQINPFYDNGTIELKLTLSGNAYRSDLFPKLQFTSNNTQFDLTFNRLSTNFTNPRFAMELAYFTKKPNPTPKVVSVNSIDDEYTPGIFKMTSWKSEDRNYLQWKPIIYLSDKRSQLNSTVLRPNLPKDLASADKTTLKDSLAWIWFGQDMSDKKNVSSGALNITFGFPKDKFYKSTPYQIWTGSIGLGEAPLPYISFVLIIIMAVGLGIPVTLIVVAFGFVCLKRARKASQGDVVRIQSDGDSEETDRLVAERERAAGYQAIN